MQLYVETTPIISDKTKSRAWTALQVVMGSLFLAACSQITIPLYPVPLTMQTLGIFILAMMQGGNKALGSTLLYLGLACLGLPVLAEGTRQSFWWLLPSAGYLVAFPIAAYVSGKMIEWRARPRAWWVLLSHFTGLCIIYTLGVLGLMRILSFEQSIMVGVIPFLPSAALKLLMASSLNGLFLRWKQR